MDILGLILLWHVQMDTLVAISVIKVTGLHLAQYVTL